MDVDESGALVIAARKTVRRLQQLSEVPARPDNLGERYVAFVSVQTGISYVVMVPLLLLEAKRLHRLEALTAPLTVPGPYPISRTLAFSRHRQAARTTPAL